MWLMLLRTFAMASCKLRTHQNHPALCFGKREGICSAGGNRELGIGGGREGGRGALPNCSRDAATKSNPWMCLISK